MTIKGLDNFMRKMKELEKSLSALDGDLAKLSFDPFDPQSIELAIQEMETEIDNRVGQSGQNDMVKAVVSQLKEQGRAAILERAASARLEVKNDDDN